MIISLSGLIGSGKDTVSDYLVEQRGFQRMSFAGTLKDSVSDIFGWDREMLEGKTKEARKQREEIDKWWADRLGMPELTPRWMLQHFGTDTCRQHFHDDIWLASLENQLRRMKNHNIVISDSRFMNELTMLKNKGAVMVSVSRGEKPSWWQTATKVHDSENARFFMEATNIHRSEWDWAGYNFDIQLDNTGSLAELYYKTDDILRSQE